MLTLISCTTGTVAQFTFPGGRCIHLPVEAWDMEGAAYVADDRGLSRVDKFARNQGMRFSRLFVASEAADEIMYEKEEREAQAKAA